MQVFMYGLFEWFLSLVLSPLIIVISLIIQVFLLVKSKVVSQPKKKSQKPTANSKYAIVITGASNGIGRALAFEYAREYTAARVDLRFGLMGTNEDRLKQVQRELAEKYGIKQAYVEYKVVDVRDREQMKRAIQDFETRFDGINLLVANAGVTEFVLKSQNENIDFETMQRDVMDINFVGVMNTVLPIANQLVESQTYRNGQHISICCVSSIAGETGSMSMYSCMKKALTEYTMFLGRRLKNNPCVTVTVACPGWVDTHMASKYMGNKAGMIDSSSAAQFIRKGVEQGAELVPFPYFAYILSRTIGALPTGILHPIFQLINLDK